MAITVELPLFPLGSVLVPGMHLPLHVFEERYRQLLSDCAGTGRFGVTLIREGAEVGGPAVPHEVGTVAEIISLHPLSDGRYSLEAVGRQRFRVQQLRHDRPYLTCDAELLPEEEGEPNEARAADVRVRAFATEYVKTLYTVLGETEETPHVQLPDDAVTLSHAVAMLLHITPLESQTLLEAGTAAERLSREVEILARELAIMRHMLRGRPRGPGREGSRYSLN